MRVQPTTNFNSLEAREGGIVRALCGAKLGWEEAS